MSYPTHGNEFHERLLAGDATDGDHASRPDPEDVAEGHLYACSDHGLIYQSDGVTTWATWFDPSTGAPGAHNHSGADITSGTVADARIDAAIARDSELPDLAAHVAASDPHPTYLTAAEGDAAYPSQAEFDDHSARHEDGGADEISIAGLAGIPAELSTHAAAADPHTGYVREADADYVDLTDGGATTLHSHAGGGGYTDEEAQDAVGGILVDSSSVDFTYADATPSVTAAVITGTTAAAIGTSAGGSAATPSKSDHVHATGAGTPTTQAFGDAAAVGAGPAAAMTDHKHAMPANPVGIPWTVVTKGSDESVASSTVVQADDELFFTAVSGALYEIEVVFMYASPAGAGTPDLKFGLNEDATIRGLFTCSLISSADSGSNIALLASSAATTVAGTAAANRPLRAAGSYVGGGGTFRLLWSQNTSDANATIVRAGSVLRYRRLV